MAFTDSLTNVLNRRGLEMCLKGLVNRNVIRKKDNIAIVFIDLDDFKTVNDTKGHEYGDFILKEAARRWKCVLRKGDYIARYGGDEFILILTNYDCQIDLSEHIYEFFETLNEGFILNESEMNISASFGVALYSEQRCNLEQLLKYADVAMNNAKRKGKRGIDIFDGYINEVEMI